MSGTNFAWGQTREVVVARARSGARHGSRPEPPPPRSLPRRRGRLQGPASSRKSEGCSQDTSPEAVLWKYSYFPS